MRASLLGLPPELRLRIYEYCLCIKEYIRLAKVGDDLEDRQQFNRDLIPKIALLSVSKLVNEEATPIFYGNNTWCMLNWGQLGTDHCPQIWEKYAQHFRRIIVHFGDYDASEKLRMHMLDDFLTRFAGKQLTARLTGYILNTASTKQGLSRKIAVAMKLPNLKSFAIVIHALEGWNFSCRNHLLEHIAETIRTQAYAILEENPKRTWKLDFKASRDQEEQEILHGLDDMAPRLTWTFRAPHHKTNVL